MSLFVNERYSGGKHVTDDTRAQVNDAIIGGNFVFNHGSNLGITVMPTTGNVTLSDGSFAFSGRTGGIVLTESVVYTPPVADTLYTKNIVSIRYTRDTSTNFETFKLAVTSSDAQESESAAAALDVTLASSKITDSTVTADFPLWSFIANASSNTTPVQLFDIVPSLAELNEADKALDKKIATQTSRIDYLAVTIIPQERTKRAEADENLQSQIDSVNSSISAINASITALGKKYISLLSGNTATGTVFTSTQPLSDFIALCFGYKNLSGEMEYYFMPVSAECITFPDLSISGSGLSLKVSRVFPRATVSATSTKFSIVFNQNSGGTLAEIIGIY